MRTARQIVKAPTARPAPKCFSQPLANDAPSDLNGSLSRYLLHSQPTISETPSTRKFETKKYVGEPVGNNVVATANGAVATTINNATNIKNRRPLRKRPSGPKKTDEISINSNDCSLSSHR